jgi:hypothetical protein
MPPINPSYVTIGTSAGHGTIQVDVGQGLGSAVSVAVTLAADLTLANPAAPGFPVEPAWTGGEVSKAYGPGSTIPNGSTIKVFAAVGTALVAAGAASYT